MTNIAIGRNARMTVLPSVKEKLQKFFREVLGCKITKKEADYDLIHLEQGNMGVMYRNYALSEADFMKATWMELTTDNPDAVKQKILAFGIQEIEYDDKKHFYFQAPGGQVFRLASK